MAERLDESQALESTTVGIFRTATVVKGGRRFSFGALVVVGDRRGGVGVGYGKGRGVPVAIEKAQKDARKSMSRIPMAGGTLPHAVTGRFGASKVRMLPAAPGTGVVAGGTVRAVLEMAGINDCLTKAYGSTNKKNLCKAVLAGLGALHTREGMERIRGRELGDSEVERMLAEQKANEPKTQEHPQATEKSKPKAAQAQAQGETETPVKPVGVTTAEETPSESAVQTPVQPGATDAPAAPPETPGTGGQVQGDINTAGEGASQEPTQS